MAQAGKNATLAGSVLLIDTAESASEVRSALLSAGLEVLHYDTVDAVRSCIEKNECDVVLFDLEFAEKIGLDVFSETLGANNDIPKIAASAKPTLSKVLKSWNRAASFFLKKPFEPQRTVALVREAVENKLAYERLIKRLTELEGANRNLVRENEQLARRTEELVILDKIAVSIASTLELDKVLSEILLSIARAARFDRVVLSLIDWDQGLEEAVMGMGISEEDYEAVLAEMTWSISGEEKAPWAPHVIDSKGKFFSDGGFGEDHIALRAKALFPGPMAKIPLVVKDVVVGTITVDNSSSKKPIAEEHTEALERFSEYAGIAIMNAKLYMRAVEAQEELKKMHQQLLEQERLKTIERMVAAVNHEINNPLCSILLSAQMLNTMVAEENEAIRHQSKLIMGNAEQIAAIVSRLESIQNTAPKPSGDMDDMFDLGNYEDTEKKRQRD